MKKITLPSILAIIFLSQLLFSFSKINSHKTFTIDGVWRVIEVQTVKPNGSTTSVFPEESQAIFAHNYYSFCWTSHSTSFRNWQLPDSIKISRFNQSIVNAGTFEIKGSSLITKAQFAMHPMFTNGQARFNCSFSGDTLILRGTSVSSPENISNPVYASGSYFVSKLIKIENIK